MPVQNLTLNIFQTQMLYICCRIQCAQSRQQVGGLLWLGQTHCYVVAISLPNLLCNQCRVFRLRILRCKHSTYLHCSELRPLKLLRAKVAFATRRTLSAEGRYSDRRRRRKDSNLRGDCSPNILAGCCFKPLSHASRMFKEY